MSSFGWSYWSFWRKVARAERRIGLKEVVGVELEGVQSVDVTKIFERAIEEEA